MDCTNSPVNGTGSFKLKVHPASMMLLNSIRFSNNWMYLHPAVVLERSALEHTPAQDRTQNVQVGA